MSLTVDIQKRVGDFTLQVSFSAGDETLGILGASGAGKSTTLQCIAGILNPDAGRIVLNGKVLFDSEQGIRVPVQKRKIGYLFQQYALFPNMTVEQNIAAALPGCTRQERKDRIEEALRLFRLTEKRKQRPSSLSGGEQQRTALARILVTEPELILLDEPFSALDGYLREQLMWELSRTLKAFGKTVLLVSHDKEEISRFCRQVLVLDQGRSEPVQPATELMLHPKTVADAMLAGYFNIEKAYPDGSSGIRVPAWGITLRKGKHDEPFQAVCLPEDAFEISQEPVPDSICCSVKGETVRNNQKVLLLKPEHAMENKYLVAEANVRNTRTDAPAWLSITENRVILLQNNEN